MQNRYQEFTDKWDKKLKRQARRKKGKPKRRKQEAPEKPKSKQPPQEQKTGFEKLQEVKALKKTIIAAFKRGNKKGLRKGWKHFDFLCKTQEDRPDLLAKSLCDIANQLHNPELTLALLAEAYEVNPNDAITLTSYGTALAQAARFDHAFDMFDRSLALDEANSVTLTSYGTALAQAARFDHAFDMFDRSLALDEANSVTLTSYGTALAQAARFDHAFDMFDRSLALDEANSVTLTSYGTALAQAARFDQAFDMFDRSLALDEANSVTLNSYGTALAQAARFDQAFDMFDRSLALDEANSVTLTSYGTALAQAARFDQAFDMFDRSLALDEANSVTLTSYGTALAQAARFDQAFDMFDRSLALDDQDSVTLTSYGTALAKIGRYDEAIAKLEQVVNSPTFKPQQYNFIYLILGRLHYLKRNELKGDDYFNLAIAHSTNQDADRLRAAKDIFASKPYSEMGIELLEEVIKSSPYYTAIRQLLARNTAGEKFFELFNPSVANTDSLNETNTLNQTIYHKIANEIALLKEIVYDLSQAWPDNKTLQTVIEFIDDLLAQIKERREQEQAQIEAISGADYHQIIATISKTAHDISDFVSNELAVIEEDIRFALEELGTQAAHYQAELDEVLTQIKFAQAAINDLKNINEGRAINKQPFSLSELFEKWEQTPTLPHATITVKLQQPEAIIIGDMPKIRSFLNELVENSLKHNPEKTDLQIVMSAKVSGPVEEQSLQIVYQDNGQGIPRDKKDWVFLPLKTTSPKGSGLGLFSIKRTLKEMDGTITETGNDGVRFKITIPCFEGEPDEEPETVSSPTAVVG